MEFLIGLWFHISFRVYVRFTLPSEKSFNSSHTTRTMRLSNPIDYLRTVDATDCGSRRGRVWPKRWVLSRRR